MKRHVAEIIREDFYSFCFKCFNEFKKASLPDDPYLRRLAGELDSFAKGETKRLLVNLPPRHYKTFFGSICLTAWIVAHWPSVRILMMSYSEDLAEQNAVAVRKIMTSKWFLRLFGTRLEIKRSDSLVTTDGGSVRSISIEGGVTGLGADFIIIDDPVQIKYANHFERLERVNSLFDGQIASRLDRPKDGGILIVAHRLNELDLSGHVLQQGGWRQLCLPLIAPRRQEYRLPNGKIWVRKKGELLCTNSFSRRELDRIANTSEYSALYQQRPGGESGLVIKREHFPRFASDACPAELTTILSIDPGQKGGPSHAFSVIQAWTRVGENFLLVDQWRDRASFAEFRSQLLRFQKKRPSVILIEDTAQGPALAGEIRPAEGLLVKLVTPIESKVERLRRHRRLIRKGRVHLPERATWREEFLEEVTLFPDLGTDDQVDALTQFLDFVTTNPWPSSRPPRAICAIARPGDRPALDFGGSRPGLKAPGCVVAARRPFRRPW